MSVSYPSTRVARRIVLVSALDLDLADAILPRGFKAKPLRGLAVGVTQVVRTEPLKAGRLPIALTPALWSCSHGILIQRSSNRGRRGYFRSMRRDIDARWLGPASGLTLPGGIHGARFTVDDQPDEFELRVETLDGQANVEVLGCPDQRWPMSALFRTGREASEELGMPKGAVSALGIARARDAWFRDHARFPYGSAELDSAFLIRDLCTVPGPEISHIEIQSEGALA